MVQNCTTCRQPWVATLLPAHVRKAVYRSCRPATCLPLAVGGEEVLKVVYFTTPDRKLQVQLLCWPLCNVVVGCCCM